MSSAPVSSWWQSRPAQGLLVLGAVVVLTLWELARHPTPLAPARATWQAANPPALQRNWHVVELGHLPQPPGVPSAHASFLLPMPAAHPCALRAFWFAGTRESAPDVQIAQSCYSRASRTWQPATVVADRMVLGPQLGLGLRRLGNPVAWQDARGRVHLFMVATGLGGWAASRVLHVQQVEADRADPAPAFAAPRLLQLSWLWNTSFLVRGAPLPLEDGGFVLPVYFELGVKTPYALRFDAQAQLRGLVRMSQRRSILQPGLVALTPKHWVALMRDNRLEGQIAAVQTQDGGATWQDLPDLALVNPDSATFVLPLGPAQALLAHNSSPRSRQVLDLSESANARDWKPLATLARGDQAPAGTVSASNADGTPAQGPRTAEFSYPALAWVDGSLWASFTEHRSRIAWQRLQAKD